MNNSKLITRADLPNLKDVTRSLYLSSSQINVTASATETLIIQIPIEANSFKRNQHLRLQAGGVAVDSTPANITAFQIFGRFGKDGLVSPLFTFNASYNLGVPVANWYMEYILSRDTGSPDQLSLGGYLNIFDPTGGVMLFQDIARGEVSADFTIFNNVYLSGLITAGANRVLATETFELTKSSMLVN